MPFNLSAGEMMVVFLVALLLFGGRLPEVARKVGSAIGEFRRGMTQEMRRIERESTEAARAAALHPEPGGERAARGSQPSTPEAEPPAAAENPPPETKSPESGDPESAP